MDAWEQTKGHFQEKYHVTITDDQKSLYDQMVGKPAKNAGCCVLILVAIILFFISGLFTGEYSTEGYTNEEALIPILVLGFLIAMQASSISKTVEQNENKFLKAINFNQNNTPAVSPNIISPNSNIPMNSTPTNNPSTFVGKTAPQPVAAANCPICGELIALNSQFCPKCGSKLLWQ